MEAVESVMEPSANYQSELDGFVKGRIAEAIVEQMFRLSEIDIYFFGKEWRQLRSSTSSEFKLVVGKDEYVYSYDGKYRAPDFLIVNRRQKPELIEVKYRRNGKIDNKDVRAFEYLNRVWRPVIIFISTYSSGKSGDIAVVKPPYTFNDGLSLIEENVMEQEEWGIDEDVYLKCLERLRILEGFFQPVNHKE